MSRFDLYVDPTIPSGYVLRVVVDELHKDTVDHIIRTGSRLIARRFLREHIGELVAKINADELAALIKNHLEDKLK